MENTAQALGQDTQLASLAAQLDGGIQTETPEVQTPAPEAERLAAKFAEAAKRNAYLRKQKQQVAAPIKEKDAEIEKMRAELDRLKKYEDTSDPMELLKLKGMSYEDIISRNLNPENFEAKEYVQKMEDKLAAMERKFEETFAKQEEEKKASLEKQKESTIAEYHEHLKRFVDKSGEKYELINAFGSHKDVYDTIEQTYAQNGKVLTDEEACDLVESFLEKQLDHLAKINKLKNKIIPVTEDNQPPGQYSETPTLSNQLTPQTNSAKRKFQSEEDEIKYAASFIKWNNN